MDKVYRIPAPRFFTDTGGTKHVFGDGDSIEVFVEPSDDYSRGADIALVISNNKEVICDCKMDKFAALCIAHAIMENLMKQEAIIYDNEDEC